MVSIWPTVNPASENYAEMSELGYLVANERGLSLQLAIWDRGSTARVPMAFYDATNPRARDYIWSKVRDNYLKYGIKTWWLDACEPELVPEQSGNLRYHLGPGLEVGNAYPMLHARGFYENMLAEGEDPELRELLLRAAERGLGPDELAALGREHGVAEWEAAGRDASTLYRGARLAGALDWASEHASDLNRLERHFLDESEAASVGEASRQRRANRRLRSGGPCEFRAPAWPAAWQPRSRIAGAIRCARPRSPSP